MTSHRLPEVEKMIATVRKRRWDCSEREAIEYMLTVATGRLRALWRYEKSVPEGQDNKGVLVQKGKKKRAPKSARIAPTQAQAAAAAQKAAKSKPKPKKARKKAEPAEAPEVVAAQ